MKRSVVSISLIILLVATLLMAIPTVRASGGTNSTSNSERISWCPVDYFWFGHHFHFWWPCPRTTPTPTPVSTRTPTKTPTKTSTLVFTSTNTLIPSSTFTWTSTFTPTNTASKTPTKTAIPTATYTSTFLPFVTNTYTPTLPPTNTPTKTLVPTATFTPSKTNTPIFTNTFTRTFTSTFTKTNVPSTNTPTRTSTVIPPTSTRTNTPITPSPTTNPNGFSFASLGDSQSGTSTLLTVDNAIKALNPSLVIFNGDLADADGSTNSEMTSKTGVYKTTGLFDKTFFVRGNHDDHLANSSNIWETFFSTSPNIPNRPAGVTNFVALNSSSTYLTYSFVYQNSMFLGVDVPGDADLITSAQYTFLDQRLTYAESIGLTHAFIWFHGGEYCVEANHCDCSSKSDGSCTPSAFVNLINKHPVVSATFHGHEHILSWTHMDNTRVSSLTRSYEEFFTSPAATYTYNSDIFTNRVDYYSNVNAPAYAYISVNGNSFTVTLYRVGTGSVWSKTFTKGSVSPTNTPVASTATRTATPVVTSTRTPTPLAQTATRTPTPVATVPSGTVLAFPGAEGFGANTVGGRGGTVYEVTNTNDSGTGSLRACVQASGARTCVFKVGGLISLTSPLTISNPFITIAGQTAPGGGITLKLGSTASDIDMFLTMTHDVIIRYLTQRPGPGGENHGNQIAKNNTPLYNIMIDHNSISWGVDSNLETWYRVYNSTISRTIVSEALNCSTHSKTDSDCTSNVTGGHSKGLMIGGYQGGEGSSSAGSENISVLNNLMSQNVDRNPLIQDCGITQVMNNVSYNAAYDFSQQQLNCVNGVSYVNWINNYHKKGVQGSQTDLGIIPSDEGSCSAGKAYLSGNVGNNGAWVTDNSCAASTIVTVPASVPSVITSTAQNAYTNVLADVGNNKGLNCDGTWYPRQDSIDTRVINDVKNGTGNIINNPSQVGGWVTPATGTPCTDTDHDGMPDVYETAQGLNPNVADGALVSANGYTNLENYLNGN